MNKFRCDNCDGYLSGKYNYINDELVFVPYPRSTNWGGSLCSTGCCLSYIHQNNKANKIIKQWKRYISCKQYKNI
jgi:hypothetical protein